MIAKLPHRNRATDALRLQQKASTQMCQDLQRILAHFGHIDVTRRIQQQEVLQIRMDLSLPLDAKTSDFSNLQRLMLV